MTPAPTDMGLLAVRQRFGPELEARIRNWPQLAQIYALAEHGDDRSDGDGTVNPASKVVAAVSEARRNLERAKRDKDYALEQAEMIARVSAQIPFGLDVVPTVRQVRRYLGIWDSIDDGAEPEGRSVLERDRAHAARLREEGVHG